MVPASSAPSAVGFAELYRRNRGFVLRSLRALQVPAAVVDDATQEVFVVVLRRLDRYDSARGPLRAWLFGICLRIARSCRRKDARVARSLEAMRSAPLDRPERYVARIEAAEVLDEVARRLTVPQWSAYMLAELEGLSGPEIADATGVPLGTVYARLSRARARVRRICAHRRAAEAPGWARAWALAWGWWPQPCASLATGAFISVRALVVTVVLALAAAGVWWGATREGSPPPGRSPDADASSRELSAQHRGTDSDGQAPRGSMDGTVATPSGDPVTARVCAWQSATPDARPRCQRTGPTGAFALPDLAPGSYRVTAAARGHRPAANYGGEVLVPAGSSATVDLVLQPGGTRVVGIVRDRTGGVVQGALVSATPYSRFHDERALATAISDGAGRFEAWVDAGSTVWRARAAGYTDGQVRAIAPGGEVEITLSPEAVLAGRVVDAVSREPVARARVSVWHDPMSPKLQGAPVYTDADGWFRLERLAPGRYKPVAQAQGRMGAAPRPVTLGLGETREDVQIEVAAVPSLAAIVQRASGQPCRYGSAEVYHRAAGFSQRRPVASDGRVKFEALVPGTYDARVVCEDRLTAASFLGVELTTDGDEVQWTVPTGAAIRGRVVTPAGEGIAGARIRIDGVERQEPRPIVSSDGGAFVVTGLESGSYRLRATSVGFADAAPLEVELADSDAAAELVLRDPGSIEGRIVDGEGAPLAGVAVVAVGQEYGARTRAASDARGRFEFAELLPGSYQVSADEALWTDSPGASVEVAAGKASALTLTLASRGAEISGVVLDSTGGPVVDAHIMVRAQHPGDRGSLAHVLRMLRERTRDAVATTDARGRFVAGGLPEVPHTVVAVRADLGDAWERGVAPGASVRLALGERTHVAGRVRLADGRVPAAFKVVAYAPRTGAIGHDWVPGRGDFRLEGIEPGSYALVVMAPQGWAQQRIDVPAGGVDDVEVVLDPRTTVRGRLVDLETGVPVGGLSIIAGTKDAPEYGFTEAMWKIRALGLGIVSGPDGGFEIPAMGRGMVRLLIAGDVLPDAPYQSHMLSVDVSGGGDIGEIPVVHGRLQGGEPAAAHGVDAGREFFCGTYDHPERPARATIASVAPGSPAAAAGLKGGDEVVSVDGHDVSGQRCYLFPHLVRVPQGSALSLSVGGRAEPVVLR